jgi:hypothetical protein
MTDALAKAMALVERHITENGGPPETVALTRYRDAQSFQSHHPDQDFASHQRQRARLVEWLEAKGVAVDHIDVDARFPARSSMSRAERAISKATGNWRNQPVSIGVTYPGQPYRLGMTLGRSSAKASIGWFILGLPKYEGGEE